MKVTSPDALADLSHADALAVEDMGRTLESVCLAPELCDDVQPEELQDLK